MARGVRGSISGRLKTTRIFAAVMVATWSEIDLCVVLTLTWNCSMVAAGVIGAEDVAQEIDRRSARWIMSFPAEIYMYVVCGEPPFPGFPEQKNRDLSHQFEILVTVWLCILYYY